MVMRPWQLRQADRDLVAALSRSLKLRSDVARALINRGITDAEAARRYLDPRLEHLSVPSDMAFLDVAVQRLGRALRTGETIGIFGDYDVDGVSSAAMIGDYLARSGANVWLRAARRDEGYGFGRAQAEELVRRGCDVLVLTDCGTSDHDAVAQVAGRGVDVLAIDHHRVAHTDWPGFALVNPHRPDCGFPYKGLCSAGLAFYAMAALRRCLVAEGVAAADPRDNLDLVALGTLSDVAPLDRDNRILVARGLQALARTERPGLRVLLELSDLRDRAPSASDVQWRLGPRLNAPGRLGDAAAALECLWSRDPDRAGAAARRCDELNAQRKRIQQQVLAEALEQAEAQPDDHFQVVAADGWHPGVIGIVAARLAETFGRPAAVITVQGDVGRGSARSVDGVDLFAVLQHCSGQLLRYGGHAAAAGFTVAADEIASLRHALNEAAGSTISDVKPPRLEVDGLISLEAVDRQLCDQLASMAPHGERNPEPVFAASSVVVEAARPVGADHLALTLRQGPETRPAIGFRMRSRQPEIGERIDVAFVPEIEYYHGSRPRLRLLDLAPVGQGVPPDTGRFATFLAAESA